MAKFKFNSFLLAGVASVALFPTVGAMAAEAAPQSAAARADTIDEIVVTARRREEALKDVPISVQAISGEALEAKGTIDLQALVAQTPGLGTTGGNPRNFSVLIRGIGYAPTAADSLDSSIGVYFDGVYQARPGQVLQDLVDTASFEVLKGPQGTLFGRNAAAGALNITSNRPSFTPSQNVEFNAGRFSFFQVKGMVTGPITDNMAYRLTAYTTQQDGWANAPFKRAFRDASRVLNIYSPETSHLIKTAGIGRQGARGQLLTNVNDKLTINIAVDVENENDTSSGFSSSSGVSEVWGPGNWGLNTTVAQQATATKALAALANHRAFGGVLNWVPKVDTEASVQNGQSRTVITQGGVAATVDYDMEWSTLTSISAWRFWNFHPPQDSDGSPLDIYNNQAITDANQYSQEVRLASNGANTVDWQGGLFFYYSQLQDHYLIHQFGADTVTWYNAYQGREVIPLSFRNQMTGAQIIEDTHVQNQNAAIYGQGTWHATDVIDLTLGARYTKDRKSGGSPVDVSHMPQSLPAGVTNAQLNAFYRAIGAIFVNPGIAYTLPGYYTTGTASVPATVGYPIGQATKAGRFTYTGSASYKFTPDITGYVNYTTGFQAGGLDLNNGSAVSGQVVAPTTTNSMEAGIKGSLFDRRMTFSTAVYNELLKGFQTSISYILPNGTYYRGATNAGDIRARGFEWDVTAALGNGVRVVFGGNYNESIYKSAPSLPAPAELSYNGVANVNATGQRAPYAPLWTISATPSWDHQIGEHEELYTYVQYSYSSSISTGVTQGAYTQVPAQSNVNVRLGFRLQDGKYDISFYANNALDKKNITAQGLLQAPAGAGITAYLGRTVSFAPPAMYGISLKAKFL